METLLNIAPFVSLFGLVRLVILISFGKARKIRQNSSDRADQFRQYTAEYLYYRNLFSRRYRDS